MSVYDTLGVPVIVNAKGTATRLSGGVMAPEVVQAMAEATQHCVDMVSLQSRASEIIADITGAEAGYVTSGAAAGLLLGTAACVTGLDPARMNRLPDTAGMRNRVVVVRSQRNFYDHAVRAAGICLVEVGLADRYAGAGVRDAEAWEIADAVDDHTACVFYVAQPQSRPPLVEVARVAHEAGVPVLVDAAGQLPPADNLRRFLREGADLVVFSGGKAIGGPQGSGMLCGRRDLVAAAALQNLDHDLLPEQWSPPSGLFQGLNLRGLPQHGIGRSCKVGKEQIVGLLVALRHFVEEDAERTIAERRQRLREIESGLADSVRRLVDNTADPSAGDPKLELRLRGTDPHTSALELILALERGDPSICADPSRLRDGVVIFSAACLREGDPSSIARRLNELMSPELEER